MAEMKARKTEVETAPICDILGGEGMGRAFRQLTYRNQVSFG